MSRSRAADDFDLIRARRDELRRERGIIEIAGPAGNPTQPRGNYQPMTNGANVCPECGAKCGWAHMPLCGRRATEGWMVGGKAIYTAPEDEGPLVGVRGLPRGKLEAWLNEPRVNAEDIRKLFPARDESGE